MSEQLRTRPVDLTDDRTSQDAPATGGEPGRVVVSRLTEQYGDLAAVSDLSFTVEPGRVTGFRGPNGAGRTHDPADAARPRRPYWRGRHHRRTALCGAARAGRVVGAVLEASAAHHGQPCADRGICNCACTPGMGTTGQP